MAELPFWDEECLRAPLPTTSLPPPPRTLFDNDLFCYENDLDNLPDDLPPLPPSPLLHVSRPSLTPPPSPPIPLSLPQTPLPEDNPSDHLPPSPSLFLSNPCTPTLSLPPPPHPCSPPPPPSSPPPLPTHQPSQPTSPILSHRPWRSFLDEHCPLRKRVKVTIIPPSSSRKRDRPSTPPPPAPPSKRSRAPARRVQATLCATRGSRLSLSVPSRRPLRPRPSARPCRRMAPVLSASLSARLACMPTRKTTSSTTLSTSSLPLVDAAVTAVSRAARTYSDTLARVAALPVAASAVALGLALPSATSTTSGLGNCLSSQHHHHQQQQPRKRRTKRKRVLLSFDDEVVAPLAEDEGMRPPNEALLRYLNSPSASVMRPTAAY